MDTLTRSLARARAGTSPTRLMLLLGSVPAAAASALVAVVGGLVWGPATGFSVLVGGLLALLVFALGVVAIRGLLNGPNQVVMAGAFGVLLLQMALIAGLLVLIVQVDRLSLAGLGAGFLLSGLVFQAGAVTAALRARVSVDPTLGTDPGRAAQGEVDR